MTTLYRVTKIETYEIEIDGDPTSAASQIGKHLETASRLTGEVIIAPINPAYVEMPIRVTNVEASFLTTFVKPDDEDKNRAVSRHDIASVGMSVFEMSALCQLGLASPELNKDGHMTGRYEITDTGRVMALQICLTNEVKAAASDGS